MGKEGGSMIIFQYFAFVVGAVCLLGAVNGAFLLRDAKNSVDFRHKFIGMLLLVLVGMVSIIFALRF